MTTKDTLAEANIAAEPNIAPEPGSATEVNIAADPGSTIEANGVPVPGVGCVLKKVLDVIGGKWKIRIICNIGKEKVLRYNELKRIVDGITNTMLANSLRELEADGFVVRTQYPEMPVRVEYTLAEKGESIMPILLELEAWGKENLVLEA